MQTVFQTALDIMAQWDDDKFDRLLGFMRDTMTDADVEYVLNKRRIMREHGNTFPRTTAFTLVKR